MSLGVPRVGRPHDLLRVLGTKLMHPVLDGLRDVVRVVSFAGFVFLVQDRLVDDGPEPVFEILGAL